MHNVIAMIRSSIRPVVSAWLVLVVAGCATTEAPKPAAQIEIMDDVGFTITEEAEIGSEVRADYDAAIALLKRGDHASGITLLESTVDRAPELSAPRIDLGIAYHQTGKLELAEQHLLGALALNPEHPIPHNELGIVYRKTGRFEEAREHYEKALDIYPGFHYARRNLAILCDLYLADLRCALAQYEAYMKTVPSDDEASMWIADLRTRLDNQE